MSARATLISAERAQQKLAASSVSASPVKINFAPRQPRTPEITNGHFGACDQHQHENARGDSKVDHLLEHSRKQVILFALLCGALFTGMIAAFGSSFVSEMFKTVQQSNDLEAPM